MPAQIDPHLTLYLRAPRVLLEDTSAGTGPPQELRRIVNLPIIEVEQADEILDELLTALAAWLEERTLAPYVEVGRDHN